MIDPQKIAEWKALIQNNAQRRRDEEEVIKRYGTMFHPANLDKLTKEDFRSFLLPKNNKHWDGIHRQVNMITEDMGKLKEALKVLLDETRSLKDRLDFLFPQNGNNLIKGLGRAIITPILMVVYPDKYGVYNNKSEEGLKTAGLLPDFKRKTFAEKYIAVNEVLKNLSRQYGLTLWQLDEIIGWIFLGNPPIDFTHPEEKPIIEELEEEQAEAYTDFGLESHLEDFLVENWEKLELSKEYEILEQDGDIIGQQYITPVGRLDLLAKSKDGKEWLVIELKKGRSSDAVVGQTLRYIGWLKENMTKDGETVKGLIVTGEDDDKLKYSLRTVDNVKHMTYQVNFTLKDGAQ